MGAGEEILKKLDTVIALLCRGPRGQVANDGEMDSAKGDSEIRFQPRAWTGEGQKGLRMSQADPAFLDMYAEMMDDDADMPKKGKEEYAGLNRRAARLARGWAARTRKGGNARPATPAASYESSNYGTSGYGASAKHAAGPDDFGGPPGDDAYGDGLPF